MPDELAKPSSRDAMRMSGEEFMRIGMRLFGDDALQWKWRAVRIFGRRWNTIWCYASEQRAVPAEIAEKLWLWDRIMDYVEVRLSARTPKERICDFFALWMALMTSDLAEWVWILKCRVCSRMVDFDQVQVPTRRLTEWATCCGQVMELESVVRSPADA